MDRVERSRGDAIAVDPKGALSCEGERLKIRNNTCDERRRGRVGATVLEVAISSLLMLMTAGATVRSVMDMKGAATITSASTKLTEQGERALARIIDDLRRSGFVAVGGRTYPHLFEDGIAGFDFAAHGHVPAEQSVSAEDPDYVTPRSIVFLQPADDDPVGTAGHGRPDVDVNGRLVWGAAEFSYLVVSVNGRNQLQRRTNGGSPRVIASDVEWVRFDDAATPGVDLPANALRVRLALRTVDAQGRVVTWNGDATVRLRNG